MAVDYLRSCYSTTMQFFDPPGPEIPVTWWFCDEAAKVYPGYTRFASGNYACDKLVWPGPGEVLDAPRTWSDGECPAPSPMTPNPQGHFPIGVGPQAATWTTTLPAIYLADSVVLVVIASYLLSGTGDLTSVVDSEGNVYAEDLDFINPDDFRVRVRVWRSFNASLATNVFVTLNFVGLQYLTVTPMSLQGFVDQGPTVIESVSGNAGVNPSFPEFASELGNRCVLSGWSCGACSAIASIPAGFTEFGRLLSSGVFEDTDVVFKMVRGKRAHHDLAWSMTSAYRWVAFAAVYEGLPNDHPTGQKFCGDPVHIAEGAPPGTPGHCQSEFGFSACCYDYQSHLRCCDFERFLGLHPQFEILILAVSFPNVDTFAHPGLKLPMTQVDDFLDFFWPNDDFLTIAGVPVAQMGFWCDGDETFYFGYFPPGSGFFKVFPEYGPWRLILNNVNPVEGVGIPLPQPERWMIEIRRLA